MRVGVSQKIFLCFATLTLFSVVLAASVFFGLRGVFSAGERIQRIREFQIQLALVENLAHEAFLHTQPFDDSAFKRALGRVQDLGSEIEGFGGDKDPAIRRSLRELPVLIDFYRKAYEELFNLLQEDGRIMEEMEGLLSAVGEGGENLSGEAMATYHRILGAYPLIHRRMFHDRDAGAVKELKDLVRSLESFTVYPSLATMLRNVGLRAEEGYFNYLAILDRQAFLEDTSRNFNRVTTDMLRIIEEDVGRRRYLLAGIIVAIVTASMLVTVILWLLASRYTGRTLKAFGRAIESVKGGDYDYEELALPADEFGELGLFMKEMSLHLGESIGQAKRGEQYLQEIIDGIAEPIIVIGRDYRVRLMNRKAMEESAVPIDELASLTCHELSHGSPIPCSGDDHPCPLRLIVTTGEMAKVQHVHGDGNGGRRYMEIVASPLLNPDGSVDGMIEAARDITDRVLAEEALKEATRSLESQNEELLKLDRIKDGLIRDVSHELKTPVAKQAMQLEILKPIIAKHHLSAAESKALLVMEESIRRQESVIRNLLDLARLEGGGREYRSEPVNLRELLEQVTEEQGYFLDRLGGTIDVEVPDLVIRSDREMLHHLFTNLLHNAVKFRKKDSAVEVKVSAAVRDGRVTIRVADRGVGLSEEERGRVFERFFQSSASNEGSGVGLTICRTIAEGLGGDIDIRSDGKGKGAEVSVTIPTGG